MNKKEIVREKIGRAAMQCFLKYGLDKTSLEDIARMVGLNKATLYYYFKSKEDIFIEVAFTEAFKFIASLQAKTLEIEGIEEQVKFYIVSRFNYYKEIVSINRVSVNSMTKILPKFYAFYDEMMREEKTFLSTIIKNAETKQEIHKTDENKVAEVLINFSDALKHGAEQQAVIRMLDTIDYAQSLIDIEYIITLIFSGLKK
ncbi:TetR/AcrR family transcriptional regulator [Flavobacterium sp.]|uniref:TetR/AcrR family transcriptional regulator n=1 Tax=Flavobacterium sp. TaxID=239 RepID=UPI00260F4008|nr:TetR/AcrR family transcriptional regulator [Flavobacterium sp.]